MDPLTLGTIASSIISGIVSLVATKKTNKTSQEISNQNIQFQQAENDMTRLREDNAQVRAAQDLQAAGLSKTLAAGSPASAAALTAPQDTRVYENPMQKAIDKMNLKQTILDLESLKADISYKEEQKKLLAQQTIAQQLSNETFMDKFHMEQTMNTFNIELAKSQIASYEANTALTKIIGENKQREIDADIDYKLAQIDLTNANVDKVKAEITTELFKQYKLSKEAALLVQDLVNAKLDEQIKKHDLNYSQKIGLPVGKTPSTWISDAQAIYQMFFGGRNGSGNTGFTFDPHSGFLTDSATGANWSVNPLSGWMPKPI